MARISLNDDSLKQPDLNEEELVDIEQPSEPQWTTTRKELWSYYIYYIGNNGLSGFNFGPSQFQNLLFLAGYDPTQEPFSVPCNDNGCVLPYLGQTRDSMPIISYAEHRILT